jgi:hypothetical protein
MEKARFVDVDRGKKVFGARVTRLGEFSPIVPMFVLGMVTTEVPMQVFGYFFHGKIYVLHTFDKNKWVGLTFGPLKKISSGHPVSDGCIGDLESKKEGFLRGRNKLNA